MTFDPIKEVHQVNILTWIYLNLISFTCLREIKTFMRPTHKLPSARTGTCYHLKNVPVKSS